MVNPTQNQLAVRDERALDLLIVAPAGCGKTEALALRIQGLLSRGDVAAPQKILVTTFSNRARDNIKDRLRFYLSARLLRDRVTVANFHGLAARVVRAHANVIGLSNTLILPENDWVGEELRKRKLDWDKRANVANRLRSLKQQPYDDMALEGKLSSPEDRMALDIERLRKRQDRLTYDDLPRLAELILSHDEVAQLYSAHFGAVIVDEFQDLTEQQLRIVNKIAWKRTTYAGDLAQGIYGFAGAKPHVIDKHIRNECCKVIQFSESHRSSPAVLEMVNALTPLTSGHVLTAAAPDSWPSGGLAATVDHASVEKEAEWVLETAKMILNRAPRHRVGVIARTASRRSCVDNAFASSDVEHYRWDDGLLDTETAKRLKAMLAQFDGRAFSEAPDQMAFLRSAVGFDSINDVDVRKSMAEALVWAQELLKKSIAPKDIRARIKIGDFSTLVNSGGVHLLSGHVGKGQQFDWVIVVGLEEGAIPDFRAKYPEQETEEARILSVMISRARHGVVLSRVAQVTTAYGRRIRKKSSRFLAHIANAYPLDSHGMTEWIKDADWRAIESR